MEHAVLRELNPAIRTQRLLEDESDLLATAVLTEDVATLRTLPEEGLQETPDRLSAAKTVTPHLVTTLRAFIGSPDLSAPKFRR